MIIRRKIWPFAVRVCMAGPSRILVLRCDRGRARALRRPLRSRVRIRNAEAARAQKFAPSFSGQHQLRRLPLTRSGSLRLRRFPDFEWLQLLKRRYQNGEPGTGAAGTCQFVVLLVVANSRPPSFGSGPSDNDESPALEALSSTQMLCRLWRVGALGHNDLPHSAFGVRGVGKYDLLSSTGRTARQPKAMSILSLRWTKGAANFSQSHRLSGRLSVATILTTLWSPLA
jgi:hypothetical protein